MSVLRIAPALLLGAAVLLPAARSAAGEPAPDPNAASFRRADAYSHLVQAGLAVARGRSADAVREIDAAVALEPDSAELNAQAASVLGMLGRRADAERFARKALALDPAQLEAVRVLADLSAARAFGTRADAQARAEAIKLYERLAREDKEAPDDIWAALARLKMASGDSAGAVEDAKRLLARRPRDENALRLLDQALVSAGRTKEALESTLAWLKEHPEDDDLLPLVIEMARDTGEWVLLESMCDTMLATDADNVRARSLRGEARLRQGKNREALDDLELARAASPRDPMIRLHVATAYEALNRLADATQLGQSLAAEFPDNTFVRILLAETLVRRGELDDAREEYAAAVKTVIGDDPESAERRDEIRMRLAVVGITPQKVAEAEKVLGTLEHPDAPAALSVRARVALLAGQPKEAKRLAKALAAKAPDEAAVIDGEAELSAGRPDKAKERFAAAVAKAGPAAHGDVAAAYRRANREADAEAELKTWVREAPDDAAAHLALGAFQERSGRFPDAEGELRKAIALDPKSAEALNYLGYSLADRGERLDEAVDLIKRALDLDPWNGAYLDSLGWAYFREGKLDEAGDPLEKAVREFPRDPSVLEHIGDYREKRGDLAAAKGFWQRALDAGPEDEKAKVTLQRKLGLADSAPSADAAPAKPTP